MAKKIYFVRHGESEANVRKVFAGQRDNSKLTTIGKEQAKLIGRRIHDSNLSIQKIYTSPLLRTKETTEIIIQNAKLKNVEVLFDERIAEYDMGDITGMPIRHVKSEELVSAKNAENPELFMNRVHELLNELLILDENILIVSHAGVGRIIEAKKRGIEPHSFYDLDPYPNAKIIELEIE